MKTVLALVLLTLAGCATGAAVKVGRDTYMVSVTRCGLCENALTVAARTAAVDCATRGLGMLFVSSQFDGRQPMFPGTATLTYRCLAEDSPEYQAPTIRKDNGVNTVN